VGRVRCVKGPASTLNISQQTLKIQKFNIMYKLKLRRMSDIVTLGITSYF
ncbi:hypothetical protein N2Q22_18965, partial [Escherichia coli]|nr:hypothetical protein [Escherichia coli]